jgi:hypothetical protein
MVQERHALRHDLRCNIQSTDNTGSFQNGNEVRVIQCLSLCLDESQFPRSA